MYVSLELVNQVKMSESRVCSPLYFKTKIFNISAYSGAKIIKTRLEMTSK
jgi:hypothetical protein